jgi:hypothetical protein
MLDAAPLRCHAAMEKLTMTRPNADNGFEFGGVRYALFYDLNTLCDLEDALDLDSLQILARAASSSRMKVVRTIFRAGLLRDHPELSETLAGQIITKITAAEARAKVVEALAAAFPSPPDAAARGDASAAAAEAE